MYSNRAATVRVNRKQKKTKFSQFFGRFSQTETELLGVGFSVAQKKTKPKDRLLFFRSVSTNPPKIDQNRPTIRSRRQKPTEAIINFGSQPPQQQKTRPKPTNVIGEKTKNRPSHVYLRFIRGSQPWSPHDTNTCTLDPL